MHLCLGLAVGALALDVIPCRQLLPVDETAADSSFAQFRSRLDQAIEDRDSSFIFSMRDEEIQVCFGDRGGCAGIEAFKNEWWGRFWGEVS